MASTWHTNEKLIIGLILISVPNFIGTVWNTSFLLQTLNTTPPLNEQVTKNSRDIALFEKYRLEEKISDAAYKSEIKSNLNAILLEIKQSGKAAAEDRLRAARSEARNEALLRRTEKHINNAESHEYRSIKSRK